MVKRVTHEAEVDFDLDPGVQDAVIWVLAEAEQTAKGYDGHFNPITGDADPGGPDEFDIDLYIYDHGGQCYKHLTRGMCEAVFGRGSYDNLLEHMEGELEEV